MGEGNLEIVLIGYIDRKGVSYLVKVSFDLFLV